MKITIETIDGKILLEDEAESIKNCIEDAVAQKANLCGANLRGADLHEVKNINKYLTTPMYILLDQTNPVRAYKIVNEINQGVYRGGLVYEINKIISEKDYDVDEYLACGKGINLASLDWCLKEWKPGYKIIVCEFNKEDIVCIPVGSDGKFRVKTCKPIRELNLADYGIDNTNA